MKLFYVPGACSLSPHIALREADLPFTLDRIDLKAGKRTQDGRSYLAINPKGYVPALELDDGNVLTEGAVIVQYIADLRPESKLAPPNGTLERVRLQEWLHFIATELHKGFSVLMNPRAGEELKSWWLDNKVLPRMDFLARSLEGRQFLHGNGFTVADGYAFYALTSWTRHLKNDLGRWRVLSDYYGRLSERPAVRSALQAEAAPVAAQ